MSCVAMLPLIGFSCYFARNLGWWRLVIVGGGCHYVCAVLVIRSRAYTTPHCTGTAFHAHVLCVEYLVILKIGQDAKNVVFVSIGYWDSCWLFRHI